eukprot:364450-Chlamydomonas_euryale.AAC.5
MICVPPMLFIVCHCLRKSLKSNLFWRMRSMTASASPSLIDASACACTTQRRGGGEKGLWPVRAQRPGAGTRARAEARQAVRMWGFAAFACASERVSGGIKALEEGIKALEGGDKGRVLVLAGGKCVSKAGVVVAVESFNPNLRSQTRTPTSHCTFRTRTPTSFITRTPTSHCPFITTGESPLQWPTAFRRAAVRCGGNNG